MSTITKITIASLVVSATLALSACQQETRLTKTTAPSGQYVSEGYAQRAQGYDWVMVTVTEKGADKLGIDITSRDDIKKPTCSFAGEAVKNSENRYEVKDDGSVLVFNFTQNSVTISSTDPVALHYHCSGGTSLADSYKKL